jgi:hypothetical protein
MRGQNDLDSHKRVEKYVGLYSYFKNKMCKLRPGTNAKLDFMQSLTLLCCYIRSKRLPKYPIKINLR